MTGPHGKKILQRDLFHSRIRDLFLIFRKKGNKFIRNTEPAFCLGKTNGTGSKTFTQGKKLMGNFPAVRSQITLQTDFSMPQQNDTVEILKFPQIFHHTKQTAGTDPRRFGSDFQKCIHLIPVVYSLLSSASNPSEIVMGRSSVLGESLRISSRCSGIF